MRESALILDWDSLKAYYARNPRSVTKTGEAFSITRVTGQGVYIELGSGRTEYVAGSNLEKAVDLLNGGESVDGPGNYRQKVYDQRPAYAWAILRDMRFVSI